MNSEDLFKLEQLGIPTDTTSMEMFDHLLKVAHHLFQELERKEEDRFREELYKLTKTASN